MASIFPSISPNVRVYTSGSFAVTERSGANGSFNAFRRGSRQVGQTLKIQFRHLSETNMNVIKSHFIERKGTFDAFLLSDALWSDYTGDPPFPLLGDTAWRFACLPEITDVSFDRFDVSVDLVSHPILQGDIISTAVPINASAATADYIYNTGQAATVPTYKIDAGPS